MLIERKNYPHLDLPIGPYVHTVSYNRFLFVSGLTAFNTPQQNGNLAAQAEAIFEQIKSILEAEKVTFKNLLKVTIFVTELADIEQLRNVLFSYYEDNLPASCLVQVKSLFVPELKIEIEAVVVVTG
jgi:2-iminobutanoate/2-iminopropanoate deaminase